MNKMRFVGHLDLMRAFQRSIKRAKLPIAYSNGFNPHQLMSFAIPLSLGVTGLAEIVEVQLKIKVEEEEIIRSLNEVLPEGLKVRDVKLLLPTEKSAASTIKSAIYEIIFHCKIDSHDKIVKDILNANEVFAWKKTKKDYKEVDIRPNIISLESEYRVVEGITVTVLKAHISTGSQSNLKVNIISEIFCEKAKIDISDIEVSYIRNELY